MLVEKTKNESFSLYKKVYSALSFKNLLRICGRPNTKYSVVNKLSQPKNGLRVLRSITDFKLYLVEKFFGTYVPILCGDNLLQSFKL